MTFSSLISGTVPHHGKYSSRNGIKISRAITHHWAGVYGGDSRLMNPNEAVSANYIIYSDGRIVGQVPEEYRAWTTGGFSYDAPSITVEIQNSEVGGVWPVSAAAFNSWVRLYADIARRYGFNAGAAASLRGHREFVATACPGPYLWDRLPEIRAKAAAINNGSSAAPVPTPSAPTTSGKTISQLADGVLRGDYGNGADRQKALGANYAAVQAEVNRRLGQGASTPTKSVSQLADEVLAGKHGNGADRQRSLGSQFNAVQAEVNRRLGLVKPSVAPGITDIDRLARAVLRGDYGNGADRQKALGANYAAVQARVNEILSGNKTVVSSRSLDDIAREVMRGDWGNGADRTRKLTAAGYNASQVQARVNALYY